jgi:pimeloyl-ACP methyl ester carboxylesterase
VKQAVVVGYWEMLLGSDPDELQAWIDAEFAKIRVPCLGVFGRPVTDPERERFGWLPDVQLEEWVGDGHFVHLVDPAPFADRLRQFVDYCTTTG